MTQTPTTTKPAVDVHELKLLHTEMAYGLKSQLESLAELLKGEHFHAASLLTPKVSEMADSVMAKIEGMIEKLSAVEAPPPAPAAEAPKPEEKPAEKPAK